MQSTKRTIEQVSGCLVAHTAHTAAHMTGLHVYNKSKLCSSLNMTIMQQKNIEVSLYLEQNRVCLNPHLRIVLYVLRYLGRKMFLYLVNKPGRR